jgi:hypothetical protein
MNDPGKARSRCQGQQPRRVSLQRVRRCGHGLLLLYSTLFNSDGLVLERKYNGQDDVITSSPVLQHLLLPLLISLLLRIQLRRKSARGPLVLRTKDQIFPLHGENGLNQPEGMASGEQFAGLTAGGSVTDDLGAADAGMHDGVPQESSPFRHSDVLEPGRCHSGSETPREEPQQDCHRDVRSRNSRDRGGERREGERRYRVPRGRSRSRSQSRSRTTRERRFRSRSSRSWEKRHHRSRSYSRERHRRKRYRCSSRRRYYSLSSDSSSSEDSSSSSSLEEEVDRMNNEEADRLAEQSTDKEYLFERNRMLSLIEAQQRHNTRAWQRQPRGAEHWK